MREREHSPIACDRMVLTAEQRSRLAVLMGQLARETEQIRELVDGYAFRYRTDESSWRTAAEYVELERRCCPFFRFVLRLEPNGGAVTLELTGGEDVKEFLRDQMRQMPDSTGGGT